MALTLIGTLVATSTVSQLTAKTVKADTITVAASVTLEAENCSYMSGAQTEPCSEGGQDVGYIDTGDWMLFNSVNLPVSGRYKVEYRVASLNGGGVISLEKVGGSEAYGTVNVPATVDGKIDLDTNRQNRSGTWDTVFDMWFYPQQNPTGGSGGFKGGYEIMVWLNYEQQGPWGGSPQDVYI